MINQNKLGLALSGGGIRGGAHLGVLKVLAQNEIYPDMISGASAGSIAGALYASGADLDKFVENVVGLKPWEFLDPAFASGYVLLFLYYFYAKKPMTMSKFPNGLFRGDKLEGLLDDVFGEAYFDDLKVPLSVVSVDIDTGETVVFCSKHNLPHEKMPEAVFITDVSVAVAVRASISLPGVFVPKRLKGRSLVDGGIKNNLPLDILQKQGADKMIAVDLSISKKQHKADSMVEILMATVDIMGSELSRYIKKNYPAYFIYPNIRAGYTDLYNMQNIVKHGEKVAIEVMPEVKRYIAM